MTYDTQSHLMFSHSKMNYLFIITDQESSRVIPELFTND